MIHGEWLFCCSSTLNVNIWIGKCNNKVIDTYCVGVCKIRQRGEMENTKGI